MHSCRHAFEAVLAASFAVMLGLPAAAQVTRPIPNIPRAGTAAPAAGRTANIVRANRIEESKQRTPDYNVNTDEQRAKVREWSRINVSYDTAPDWIDEMEVRFYVGVKGKNTGAVMFQATVTFVDVPRGSHAEAVFLSPGALERYGSVEAMAAEFFVKGEKVAVVTHPAVSPVAAPWWASGSLKTIEGRLLNRAQTPFAFVAIDGHNEIKQK